MKKIGFFLCLILLAFNVTVFSYDSIDIFAQGYGNTKYTISIYKPRASEDMTDRFVYIYSSDDLNQLRTLEPFEVSCILADRSVIKSASKGEIQYAFETEDPGRYQIEFVSENGMDVIIQDIIVGSDELMRANAAENFSDDNIVDALSVITGYEQNRINKIYDYYLLLKNKGNVFESANGKVKNVFASILFQYIYEENSADATVLAMLKNELEYLEINTMPITLLENYEGQISNVMQDIKIGDISSCIVELEESIILNGIDDCYNYKNCKKYIELLNNNKYDDSNEGQKDIIAQNIAYKKYASLDELNSEINSIQLSAEAISNPKGGGAGGIVATAVLADNDNITTESDQRIGTGGYKDVTTSHWAYSYISRLAELNIISGYDGNYIPDMPVTRSEFVKMIVLAFNIDGETDTPFEDVREDDWYYQYIVKATSRNIIKGDEGKFLPNDDITREDAAVIVTRCMENKTADSSILSFIDKEEISEYALASIAALVNKSVIQGFSDGRFIPKGSLTRAEAAKIICGIL